MSHDELIKKAREIAWRLAWLGVHVYELRHVYNANLFRDLADALEETQEELNKVKVSELDFDDEAEERSMGTQQEEG